MREEGGNLNYGPSGGGGGWRGVEAAVNCSTVAVEAFDIVSHVQLSFTNILQHRQDEWVNKREMYQATRRDSDGRLGQTET